MPKVVSRYTISSSEQAKPSSTSRAVLRSYYCLCGDFTLVIQGKLDRLPRRKSDGSYIVRSKDSKDGKIPGRKFKLNATPGDRYLLQRKDGKMEVRQPFLCGRCNVIVAYQMTPPPAGSGPFLYFLRGAVTETQGEVPDEAFEGEDQVFDPDDLANELFDEVDVALAGDTVPSDSAGRDATTTEDKGAGERATLQAAEPQPETHPDA